MCLSACFLDAEVQDGMLMIVNVLLHVVFQELFKKRHKIGANAPWRVDSACECPFEGAAPEGERGNEAQPVPNGCWRR